MPTKLEENGRLETIRAELAAQEEAEIQEIQRELQEFLLKRNLTLEPVLIISPGRVEGSIRLVRKPD